MPWQQDDLQARLAAARARRAAASPSLTPLDGGDDDLRARLAEIRARRASPPPTTTAPRPGTGGRMGGPGRAGITGPVGRYSTPEIAPPPEDENAPGWGPTAIRTASGFAPGLLWGAAAGGIGEYLAQKAEGRDDLNYWQIAGQTALGAVPFKSGGKALWNLLRGAGTGALMSTGAEAMDQIHEGDLDVGRLGTSAAMGAGLGTLGGGAVHGFEKLRKSDLGARMSEWMAARRPSAPSEVVFNDQRVPSRQIPGSRGGPPPTPPTAPVTPDPRYAPKRPYPLAEDTGEATGTVEFNDQTIPPRVLRTEPDTPSTAARAADTVPTPAPVPLSLDAIGGPEHAAEVIRRVRERKGLVQYPRGTDPEIMLGRQVDDPLAGADLGPSPAPSTVRRDPAASLAPEPVPPTAAVAPVDFDAPLTEAELAAARQGAPARTRLSPAAKRRDRRAKLEASIRAAGGAPGGKPHYTAEQVAEHRTQAGYDTLAPDDVPTPAQAAARFPSLPEGELRDLLERFAFKRQQIDSAGLGFDDFVKHERRAPGLNAGNKEVDALDARYRVLTDPNSERGAISQDLAFDIAAPVAGAAIGAPIGAALDDDNAVGATGGALAGGLAGLGMRRPGALSTLMYGGMLGSPVSMAKGIAGSTGSTLLDALEKGDLPTVLRNAASMDTVRAAGRGFVDGGVAGRTRPSSSGPGSVWNPLRVPGRILGAADAAGQDVLTRSGRTAEEAADSMLTGEPKSSFGKGLLNLQQGLVTKGSRPSQAASFVGETLVPFARTIVNGVERGLEATPGVGFLPGVRSMRNLDLPTSARKQGVGLLAMLAGGAAGEQASEYDEGSWGRRAWDVAPIAMGPFALPAALGYQGSMAAQKPGATPYSVSNAMIENARQILPTPEVPRLSEYLQRAIPRDLSTLLGGEDPYSYDTTRSHFAKPISRIPWLNDYLLRQRAARGTGTTRTRRRASRPSRGGR